ncbi:PREDICTED: uncharacterized protein LOC105134329 [Populus euphratica]|uniref:Uncharacterized protein LOC105134329 n=1 Tax=Populus euphratica TaxID=75702 RepID=A0AAJ6UWP9_POPEU|nr:PREDICTED: uncharacterized protein LOC105134329 [Populus euphratica]
MSLQSGDLPGPNQHVETSNESRKKLKISYTRKFLLSLSELDVCKKLPSGFDQSLLSELGDTSQDRYRIPGSASSQSFRRNDYSSSPPTRGDSSNFSRGIHGRWDSRSSGRSDRDSDSQSDWDSDAGRRYGNQSRRSGQVPEHDGLLGSGSFPRPSGYGAGLSAPKFRSNDQFQLNKSNELYQPPRPYRAMPHSRRETDSLNDETFGSSEYTSDDRAEEERKRRASFESMRKEQHKAFQEKQKLNPEKYKDASDVAELLEDSKDNKKLLNGSNELDKTVIQPMPINDPDKPLHPLQAPVSRPLVPPGFSSAIVEKHAGAKSLTNSHPSEVDIELEGSLLQKKGTHVLDESSNNQDRKQFLEEMNLNAQHSRSPSACVSVDNKSENILNLAAALDVSSKRIGSKTSNLPEAFIDSENSEAIDLDAENVPGNKNVGESGSSHSTSILDKLFGSALTLNGAGSSSFIEHHDVKADDSRSPQTGQSSKFAQWFSEEEKKPVDNLPSGRPNDLLSLIVGGEKGGSQVKTTDHMRPTFPFQSFELADRHLTSNQKSVSIENNEELSITGKLDAAPAVLTCEDLEQSILSEITENGSALPPPVYGWGGGDVKAEQQKADVHASQHLLSLLQKGAGLNNLAPSANLGISATDRQQNSGVANPSKAAPKPRHADAENIPNSGKALTLETLFGTDIMKELQSVGAPISSQRDSIGYARDDASESHGLPIPVIDDGLLPQTVEIPSSMSSHGSGVLASKQRQQIVLDRTEEHLLGFDPQNEADSSHLRTEMSSKLGGFDGSYEIQLPEEDSLIAVSDPLNLRNFLLARNSTKSELMPIPGTSVDIAEKLAALNSGFRDERPTVGHKGPPFLRGPYDMREPDVHYHNLHVQPSSPQLQPQLNRPRPMLHPLDSHPANMNAQMKLVAPENIRHDTPNHQFPENMLRPPFHHPSNALTGFDPTTRDAMLHQLHMRGNFPSPLLRRELPRGAIPHPHPNNQVTGFMQESSPMQGFPIGQRQPYFGALGIPPQANDGGVESNQPEALQRLIEMELRSNSKQIHPFATPGHGPGIYGHELDMSFGYR